jgi:hypothetical protein
MVIKTPNPSMEREYPSMSQVKRAQISTPLTNNTTVLIVHKKWHLNLLTSFITRVFEFNHKTKVEQ